MQMDVHLFSNSRGFLNGLNGPYKVTAIPDLDRRIVRRIGAHEVLRRVPEPVSTIDMPRTAVPSLQEIGKLPELVFLPDKTEPYDPRPSLPQDNQVHEGVGNPGAVLPTLVGYFFHLRPPLAYWFLRTSSMAATFSGFESFGTSWEGAAM